MTAGDVLVLNASYEPLQRVSLRHAIKMLVREVAVIEEVDDGTFGPFPRPKVLRLVRYVVARWMHRRSHLCTKNAIKARDKVCAYCGGHAETVDHVVPRSRVICSDCSPSQHMQHCSSDLFVVRHYRRVPQDVARGCKVGRGWARALGSALR